MKENKKIIILGFFIVFIVVIVSFIFGVSLANKGESKAQTKPENNSEEVDIGYLATMIPKYNGEGYNVYQNKLITIDEIPSDKLSLSVYVELIENYEDEVVARAGDEFSGVPDPNDYDDEKEYEIVYKQKCLDTGNLYFALSCYVIGNESGAVAYSEKTIEKVYKKLYGENYVYTSPDFIGYFAGGCWLQDGYYFCEEGGGFGPGGEYNYSIIVDSEVKNDNVYIYEDYFYVDIVCDNDYENCVSVIFSDFNKTEKIGELKTDEEDAFEKFGDKAKTYKHTYKKNSDGTYYWYSVEPVK